MFQLVRERLIKKLWDGYISAIPAYNKFFTNGLPVLDHLAIIDLSSQFTGMNYLARIFASIGFTQVGTGYLPDKQNDFLWMQQEDETGKLPHEMLPQVVLADFRLDELSRGTRKILEKYTQYTHPFNYDAFEHYCRELRSGDLNASASIAKHIFDYLATRQWPIPEIHDYRQVFEENELIAWVLLFGRKVNHFGIAIHLLGEYNDLAEFNNHIHSRGLARLNTIGGVIKGGEHCKISQSSTVGETVTAPLMDGHIEVADSFMEFVWRYPVTTDPELWVDYYTGFIARNANDVIESVYKLSHQ